ncbi:MAG TPA: three-Cys-motif partner protein TcmP [Pyrinomonadaceae bacterium]
MKKAKYDKIGYWSEVKLDIVREYASAYSRIMNAQKSFRKYSYIDAFAGAGQHISKRTGHFIPGSPLNALWIEPPFGEFHLIDLDGSRAAELREIVGKRNDVTVYEEDANKVLLQKVFPRCKYENYQRALCLLDPYKITVDWKVIETAGKMRSIEIFYNFMIMDANMNVLWHNPDRVSDVQSRRMDAVWGDHSWREIAYQKVPGLFGDIEKKTDNETIAKAFRDRLSSVAGFKYVPEPIPMRNDQGAVVYYLYFASQKETGAGIVADIFKKYRNKGTR